MLENDALSLEYKLLYGTPKRNLDLADIVNNPVGAGVRDILGLFFKEKTRDVVFGETSPVLDNLANPLLIRQD